MTTRPETIRALLARIDEQYGSIEVLLELLEVSPEVREVLRARLTEEAANAPLLGVGTGR
jgi:hypothetical protein